MTCSRGRKQVVSERDGKLFQLFPSRVRLVGTSESRLNSKGATQQARVWLHGTVESELYTSRASQQAGVRLSRASQSWVRVWDRGPRKTSAAGALPQVYIFVPRLGLPSSLSKWSSWPWPRCPGVDVEKLLALDIARAASAPMRQVESGRKHHTLP